MNQVELHTDYDDLINEASFLKLLDVLYYKEMSFSPEDIFHVTVTAQYFQMHSIVAFCEDKISDMIKSSNAIDIYHFADKYFLRKTKEHVFQWMLLRLFPVRCWDQLNYLTIDLCEKLISHPRLVTQNEMYLYFVLKMLIQIRINGTCVQDNETFYKKIRNNKVPFLLTKEGTSFQKAFEALRLGNILVRKENVEVILRDNIISRKVVDDCIFKNWMSLVSIESSENFGPTAELVTRHEFETHAMRFAKVINAPDYHSWKFIGFSYAFDLALFFDGRTFIVKRCHRINEQKISHSHLLRTIMMRFDIFEINSVESNRQEEIQTITLTTNEELCMKQLTKELKYPCRLSIEVLFHVPYKAAEAGKNFNLTIDNEQEDQSTGNLLQTSIMAKTFQSNKLFFK